MNFEIDVKGRWISDSLEGHCYDESLCRAIGGYLKQQGWKSVLDLGCGPGWYVRDLRSLGFIIHGFDGNPHTVAISRGILNDGTYCEVLDLTEPQKSLSSSDCVMSLEVGEHIPEQYESVFIENITSYASKGLILSWAIPGQGGTGHVNLKSNKYIIERLKEKGFCEDIGAKNKLRLKATLPWFANTIMVFKRKK